jgi:hypothetical protein
MRRGVADLPPAQQMLGPSAPLAASCYYYVVHDNMRSHYGLPVYMSVDYDMARDFFATYQPDWADAYEVGEPMAQLYEYGWETLTGRLQLRLLDQKVR